MRQITLPNGIEYKGLWTKTVVLDEMTGDEEDILADQERKQDGSGLLVVSGPARMSQILSRCTVSVGDNGDVKRPVGSDRFEDPEFFLDMWANAYARDRELAIIRLRQLSIGDSYQFSETCPSCRKEIPKVTYDLGKQEVRSIDLEVASLPSHDTTLPRKGDVVSWGLQRGEADEIAAEEVTRDFPGAFLSELMAQRVKAVNGKKLRMADTRKYVQRLSAADRQALREAMEQGEGRYDTQIEIVCGNPACRATFYRPLSVARMSFFFPSAAPSVLSKTSASLPKSGDGAQTQPSDSSSVGGEDSGVGSSNTSASEL